MQSNHFLFRLALVCVWAVLCTPAALAQSAQTPDNVETRTFGDWQTRCPEDGGRCEMTQLVNSPDNGNPILRLVMGYPPEIDGAAMVMILPLGTRLAPGVQVSVDGDQPRRVPFQICLEQGCRADFPVDDTLRGKLRSGRSATVSLIDPRGEQMDLTVSLSGFTDADNYIRQ